MHKAAAVLQELARVGPLLRWATTVLHASFCQVLLVQGSHSVDCGQFMLHENSFPYIAAGLRRTTFQFRFVADAKDMYALSR